MCYGISLMKDHHDAVLIVEANGSSERVLDEEVVFEEVVYQCFASGGGEQEKQQ